MFSRVEGRNAKYLWLGRKLRQQAHEACHFCLRRGVLAGQKVVETYREKCDIYMQCLAYGM